MEIKVCYPNYVLGRNGFNYGGIAHVKVDLGFIPHYNDFLAILTTTDGEYFKYCITT